MRGGREVQEGGDIWLIHVDVWQKPKQYCKATILQLIFQRTNPFRERIALKHIHYPYVKQIASGSLMHDTGHSKLAPAHVKGDDMTTWREGWGRRREGGLRMERIHVCLWLIHIDVWQIHHTIVIILQLKEIKFKKQK